MMTLMIQNGPLPLDVVMPNGALVKFPPGKHEIADALVAYVTSVGGAMHYWHQATIADARPGDEVLVVRDMGMGDMLMLRPAIRGLLRKGIIVRLATLPRYMDLFWDLPISVIPLAEGQGSPPAGKGEIVADIRHMVERAGPFTVADRTDLFAYHLYVNLTEEDLRAPMAVPPEVQQKVDEWMAAAGLAPGVVGVCCLASSATRTWPHWRELCHELVARGLPTVTLDGTPHPDSGATADASSLNIMEAAALAKRCSVVVSPDTGILHLASAVGTPTIGLFGSWRGELRTSHYAKCYVIQGAGACVPCYDRPSCGDPGRPPCLDGIGVGTVLEVLGLNDENSG